MISLWIAGLLRHRSTRLAGTALGIALTVALLATLGFFLVASSATMTARAISGVPIDWQVEVVPGADPAAIRDAIAKAAAVTAIDAAFYARVDGLQATTGGTVQTTGPGKVIAFDAAYPSHFPMEIRLLSGRLDGVLIAQQTAANLHVGPGDTVMVNRPGLGAAAVTIAGVVDLPDADSLFQAVGLPAQAAPQAPPDNVLVLPLADWHRLFDPQQTVRPDSTRQQFHVSLDHAVLSVQPGDAYTQVNGAARNLEARVAGQALVANTLGARLDAVRGDAIYASLLFLFLGLPGAALGAALTLAVAASGPDRRRAEQALLQIRGAGLRQILILSGAEALLVGVAGSAAGLAGAGAFAFAGNNLFAGSVMLSGLTILLSAVSGLILAATAVVFPAWVALRGKNVSSLRKGVGRVAEPLWQRWWLDMILLAAAGLLFWQTASTGYQIVLAPEGVAATATDYKAFLAPALFWIGATLLVIRIVATTIRTNGALLRGLIRPVAQQLAPVVGASLSHQNRRITLGIAMTALAVAFGTSTALFNTTYQAQAQVDAQLTNGADVAVFGAAINPAGPWLTKLAALSGVAAAEPMMHRFAYVGADLQDIYGIDPHRIGLVASLSDAFFPGGTSAQVLQTLSGTPDGVLVSEETVQDFQLTLGDMINLRLIDTRDHQYHAVPFHFIGVVTEFPTAPKDSFLVANSAYLAKMTGSPVAEVVLMRAARDPAQVAGTVRTTLGPSGLTVGEIGSVTHIIGSSLTAVNMTSLTRIELAFAVLMAAASAGLMLALGFHDRKRGFAILAAIGAKPAQLGAFLWAEGGLVILGGSVLGLVTGGIIAWMMVKLLTGVFDPPPEALSVPWAYIGLLLILVAASAIVAVIVAGNGLRHGATAIIRDV